MQRRGRRSARPRRRVPRGARGVEAPSPGRRPCRRTGCPGRGTGTPTPPGPRAPPRSGRPSASTNGVSGGFSMARGRLVELRPRAPRRRRARPRAAPASSRGSRAARRARRRARGSPSARSASARGTVDERRPASSAPSSTTAPSARCAGAQAGARRRPGVLLERHVEVAAAEAEARHRRAPRVRRVADPRARLRCSGRTGSSRSRASGSGASTLIVGGSTLWCSAMHRLDQARRAGRRLGVADLRLHRAERAPLRGRRGPLASNASLQALELGGVAGLGAGAVRLDQLDRLRAVAGRLVGAAQRASPAPRAAARRRSCSRPSDDEPMPRITA